MKKQSDEIYKICQNCGKLMKWKDKVCPYCSARYHKARFVQIRGSLYHPVGQNKLIVRKRPISITLVTFFIIIFLLAIMVFSFTYPPTPLMAVIICFPVFTVITFSLIFVNLRKNKKRMISFIVLTCILIAVTVISNFLSNKYERINFTENIIEDNGAETTIVENIEKSENAISAQEVIDTSAENEIVSPEIKKIHPTLELIVYEGPIMVHEDLCYYRVEAIVSGNPHPIIKFSKDDSNGAWGENKAQINLKNGESYDLIVTASNSIGEVVEHMLFTWNK